jgi:hypothetical protein
LNVEDHIRRRRLKAIMSRLAGPDASTSSRVFACCYATRMPSPGKQWNAGQSWDKAPAKVCQEPIAGTKTWTITLCMMKGSQDDPIDTVRAQVLRIYCRLAGFPGHSYTSVGQLRASAAEYMRENGLILQLNGAKQWELPAPPGVGVLQQVMLPAVAICIQTQSRKWSSSRQVISTARTKKWEPKIGCALWVGLVTKLRFRLLQNRQDARLHAVAGRNIC